MILLTPQHRREERPPAIAVFGAGLIGSAFVDRAAGELACERRFLPLSWDDPELRREQLVRVAAELLAACRAGQPPGGAGPLAVLWSAGRAGFQATAEQADGELASFREVVEAVQGLAGDLPRVTFGMISSAGGLFEGQRSVGRGARPAPKRPYGELKLQQEKLLAASADRLVARVYRLTSVYGHLARGRRQGLIPTLVHDGVRRRVTRITGRLETLRDFIWAEDVARFVLRDLLTAPEEASASSPMVLASGKPSSIHEVQRLVERTVGHRLYLSYVTNATNSADITFSTGAIAPGWVGSDVACTVRQIYLRILCHGTPAKAVRARGAGSP